MLFDFTKAFDRVNYWKLFNKLLDDNVPYNVVALLSLWYSHQQVNVRWDYAVFVIIMVRGKGAFCHHIYSLDTSLKQSLLL